MSDIEKTTPQKRFEEIIEQIRRRAEELDLDVSDGEVSYPEDIRDEYENLADRIEAAAKHEREQVGNTDMLDNVLDEIIEKIDKWRTDGTMEHWQYSQLFDIVDAAFVEAAKAKPDENSGNAEVAEGLPYAIIDGKPVAVLHGRVAKAPDGKIYDVIPASPGNTAAMREALEKCRDYFYDLLRSELFAAQTVQQTGNPTMDHVKGEQRLYEEIAAALSAPPRNCDLYKDDKEAWEAFEKSSAGMWAADWNWAFAKWLLEQAKDENGGAK